MSVLLAWQQVSPLAPLYSVTAQLFSSPKRSKWLLVDLSLFPSICFTSAQPNMCVCVCVTACQHCEDTSWLFDRQDLLLAENLGKRSPSGNCWSSEMRTARRCYGTNLRCDTGHGNFEWRMETKFCLDGELICTPIHEDFSKSRFTRGVEYHFLKSVWLRWKSQEGGTNVGSETCEAEEDETRNKTQTSASTWAHICVGLGFGLCSSLNESIVMICP